MNILVLSFGNNLLEDYYADCLKQIFVDNTISLKFIDLAALEYNMHVKKMQYDESDSLMLRLKGVSKVQNVVADCVHNTIASDNIDAVICLSHEAVWYLEQNELNIPVFCFIYESSSVKSDSFAVTEYFVLSENDRRYLAGKGIDESKIRVSGLAGSRNIISKEDSAFFLENSCTFITDGSDFDNISRFFDIVLKSSLRDVNFIVVSTCCRNFCDIFNSRYMRYENIRSVYCTRDIYRYISVSDFIIVDTGLFDLMNSAINNKPVIVTKNSITNGLLNQFINDKCIAFYSQNNKDALVLLEKLNANSFLCENLKASQREIINHNSDNIIYNDIINKIYIKKGKENEQQSSS